MVNVHQEKATSVVICQQGISFWQIIFSFQIMIEYSININLFINQIHWFVNITKSWSLLFNNVFFSLSLEISGVFAKIIKNKQWVHCRDLHQSKLLSSYCVTVATPKVESKNLDGCDSNLRFPFNMSKAASSCGTPNSRYNNCFLKNTTFSALLK